MNKEKRKGKSLFAIITVFVMIAALIFVAPLTANADSGENSADAVIQLIDKDGDDYYAGKISAGQVMSDLRAVVVSDAVLSALESKRQVAEEKATAYRNEVEDFENDLAKFIENMNMAGTNSSSEVMLLSSSVETYSPEEFETYYAELKAAEDGFENGVSGDEIWEIIERRPSLVSDLPDDSLEDSYDNFVDARKEFRLELERVRAVYRAIAAMENSTSDEPYIEYAPEMNSTLKVTYNCIWFGSYPQLEIVDKPENSGVYRYWEPHDSYKVNTRIYKLLQKATDWDENGDITIEGAKYRRIKQSDTLTETNDTFDWKYQTEKYHYFQYMPIKWRILDHETSFPHDKIMLVADKILDCQPYNVENKSVTWKTSTLRSWMNGLGSDSNACGIDYSGKNFIDTAFTDEEQSRIFTTDLETYPYDYDAYPDEKDTQDKAFLLDFHDIHGYYHPSYGFTQAISYDEAGYRMGSAYARAMGTYCANNKDTGNWWLRSHGDYANEAAVMLSSGAALDDGSTVDLQTGIVPVIVVAGSSDDYYTAAGTYCTDGTLNEENTPIVKETQSGSVTVKAKKVKYAKVKKKAQTVAPIAAKGMVGTVRYKIVSGSKAAKKALKINAKTGKVTVKKKTKKGTYKVKVRVTATGNAYFEPATITKTITVKVVK